MGDEWGVLPSPATLACALRSLACQLAGAVDAETAEDLLRKAEGAGLQLALGAAAGDSGCAAAAAIESATSSSADGSTGASSAASGEAAVAPISKPPALPQLKADVAAALLSVYGAAAAAAQRSMSAEMAAVAAAAAEQRLALDAACCEQLVQCWESEAASNRGAKQALPLQPLLEQLLGQEAVQAVEDAAYAGGQVVLPQPTRSLKDASAAAAEAAGLLAWHAGEAPLQQEPGQAASQQASHQAQQEAQQRQQQQQQQQEVEAALRSALRRGKLSHATVSACWGMEKEQLLAVLVGMADKKQVGVWV